MGRSVLGGCERPLAIQLTLHRLFLPVQQAGERQGRFARQGARLLFCLGGQTGALRSLSSWGAIVRAIKARLRCSNAT